MGNAVQINSNALDVKSNASIVGVLTATSFVGGLTGDVTLGCYWRCNRNIYSELCHNITGTSHIYWKWISNVTGNLTGNVTGNLTGNVNASGVSHIY